MATGRSDFPKQINNALAFPAIFRGAINVRARCINEAMKRAAATAIAECVFHRGPRTRVYRAASFHPGGIKRVAAAVENAAIQTGVARLVAASDRDA
jgi:malate dehydrogenase (oxaloacetate-decarboxylating)